MTYHHSPDQAVSGAPHLAHVLEAADHYINTIGYGMPPYRHHQIVNFEESYQKLGLKDCILKVAEAFQTEFEAVRAYF